MKHFKLLFVLLIGLGLMFTSCKKTEEQQTEDLMEEILDVKGSIDLDVAGTTYDKLFSSVVYAESDKMVSFWAYELNSEDSFVVTFGEVPEVGATANIDLQDDNTITLLVMGSFLGGDGYFATSGSIQRVSTDEYQLNIMINDMNQSGEPISLSGAVKVGEHNP